MGTKQPLPNPSPPLSPPAPLDYLKITVRPSFEPEESFRITAKPDKDTGQVRYTLRYEVRVGDDLWDRASGQVVLSDQQVRAIGNLCRDIKVLPKDNPDIGLDGTTTEITIMRGGGKLKLEYWEKPPIGWGPVKELIKRVRAIARRAVAKQGGGLPGKKNFLKSLG